MWKTAGKDSSEACAIAFKTAQFTQFFRQVWRHIVKSLSLTESVQGAYGRELFRHTSREVCPAGVPSCVLERGSTGIT